ncbi:NAD(P)-dependent oxidoreductase [Caldimonas brevitalea]|uniref:3-hydroxyisobutyrate dehydrogenase n=1 Tax=Caldimonas brevitalea TaxID=413882 RepID=A0A0G3BV39_9BURK|nr:NAD(P)-dependent oxidoreductase [Caldimonas brevitalea]AKJ31883.1 3-hydroxyisobutyrate dehydrogenase [Caldimonas brevitalea]
MEIKHITVAVLGTGLIGAPVARNLANKGFRVKVWNRTASKASAIAQANLQACTSVAEAVSEASHIVTVLKDGDSVAAAIEAGAGHFQPGAIWVQLSTVGVEASLDLARRAEEHQLVYFDAPVQGTRQPAEQGQLVILASGPVAQRVSVQPLFDAIGKRTVWVAETPGHSSRLKLALNSWVFALTHGLAESLALAKGLGVDPQLVIDVVSNGPMDCTYFQLKSAAMLAGNYTPSFSVANAAKDAQLIVEAARQAGVRADVVEAGLRRFQRAVAAGHGDKDMAASFLASDAPPDVTAPGADDDSCAHPPDRACCRRRTRGPAPVPDARSAPACTARRGRGPRGGGWQGLSMGLRSTRGPPTRRIQPQGQGVRSRPDAEEAFNLMLFSLPTGMLGVHSEIRQRKAATAHDVDGIRTDAPPKFASLATAAPMPRSPAAGSARPGLHVLGTRPSAGSG